MDSLETYSVDKAMIDERQTYDKARLGANLILAVSIAGARVAKTAADLAAVSFPWRRAGTILPVPLYEYN